MPRKASNGSANCTEAELRGLDPQRETGAFSATGRRNARWLVYQRACVATKFPLGEALAYVANYWDGLKLFLTDGHIEIDIDPKSALFAGHDAGAENWATIASLLRPLAPRR